MENVKTTNVAVYIDYENIHKTLTKSNTNVLRKGFFEKLRAWCATNNKRIVQTRVYCNFDNDDLYQSHHQTTLQNYGVETIHTSNQGKNYADLKISIDVLTSMYSNNNIDEFIIVSNDKDMIPLLNSIRANKRNVCVITAGEDYNRSICEFADQHISLEEVCKTEVEHLIITDLKDRLWKNLCDHFDDKIKSYQNGESYSDYTFDYNVRNSVTYYKLMVYEMFTLFKELYEENKILFYTYKYSGKSHIAIIPANKKQFFLDSNIIDEKAFIENYDIDKIIISEYQKFCK
ncbi:MAG: NYN domain-containing protein [Ruminococcaceae bacterium]|nr:NYN domain-containing protein [Oscillospiraceae bacterium]